MGGRARTSAFPAIGAVAVGILAIVGTALYTFFTTSTEEAGVIAVLLATSRAIAGTLIPVITRMLILAATGIVIVTGAAVNAVLSLFQAKGHEGS